MDTLQIKICSKIVKLGLYLDERQTLIEKIVTRDSVNPITPGEGGGSGPPHIEYSIQFNFVKKSCTNGNFLAQS